MKLVIATSNTGKIAEFKAYLRDSSLELYSLADFPDMPEIIENGTTFMENALIKARTVMSCTGTAALADDSGLEADALDGRPGVMSARFAPTTNARNAKLLELMKDVADEKRTARFVCSLAFVRPDGFEWTTTGICEGRITREPSGNKGFGYDPVFYYDPMNATFADIAQEVKNKISHRGQALKEFKEAIKKCRITENSKR
ncbi:MAG: XTP/dITP diphosphatase [Candidatus Latescibacteria bacterium]|mgnify:CR=1 FL=1|jgi:XTP/dITP diphosphohydrolase|nr:XTP/dITP diphosphatase [Candidatus Latescibacterota bacterium]